MKYIAAIVLTLLLHSSPRAFERITGPIWYNDIPHVVIDGRFTTNSHTMLQDILHQAPDILYIHANSSGGVATKLPQIMDMIYLHGNVIWVVSETSRCGSACAFAAVAARHQFGTFRFHGIRNSKTGVLVDSANQQILKRLLQYGYDIDTANSMLQHEQITKVFE